MAEATIREIEFAPGKTMSLETGRLAKQADGSVVVRQGDTLWDLATHYFSNPFGWRRIAEANTRVVEDPHWIYPEEVLIIPGMYDPEDPTPTPVVAVRPMDRPLRTVFFRQPVQTAGNDQPTVLSEAPLTVLPVKPGEFHAAEFLADPGDLDVVARMIRPVRSVELAQRESRATAHPRDMVFLGYAGRERPAVGSRLLMLRQGRTVWGEGRVMHPTGIVQVVALHDEVIEGRIERQFGPILLDQVAVPLQLFPDFVALTPEPVQGPDVEATVITFATEQPLYGVTERGFMNAGSRHGVNVGDVFVAYLPERAARRVDVDEFGRNIEQLPPEAVAELRVVRVADEHATFRVDKLVLPVLEEGMRVRRIRRMP